LKKQSNIIWACALGFMLLLPFPSFSTTDSGETVTRHGTISDDYYVTGGTVEIDAEIAADALVSGGELYIGHRIAGDLMTAGGSVNISGEIADDVRTAGGEISIDANIGDDLIAAGGKIRVSSGTTTGGDARLAGGYVLMAGAINKDLFIGAGNIRLSGTIHGDVELQGGDIEILEGALIEGDLYYKSHHEAKIHPEARIIGNVTYEQVERDHPHRGFGLFFSLTLIVASIVMFLLFPGFTMSAAGRISTNPWKSLGVGFALLVVAPITAVLLMGMVLGVWVGLSILAFYFVALLIGFLIACFFLGDWGARRLHKDVATRGRRLLSVTIAIVLVGLVQFIPLIGGLFMFALLLLGLGAGSVQLHSIYSKSKGG